MITENDVDVTALVAPSTLVGECDEGELLLVPVRLQVVAEDTCMRAGVSAVAAAVGLKVVAHPAARTLRVLPTALRGQLATLISLAEWWVTRAVSERWPGIPICILLIDLPRAFVIGTLRAQPPPDPSPEDHAAGLAARPVGGRSAPGTLAGAAHPPATRRHTAGAADMAGIRPP